jgi:hypothetical protein
MKVHSMQASSLQPWVRALGVGVLAVAVAVVLPPMVGAGAPQSSFPHVPPEITRLPDSNQVNAINAKETASQAFEAANTERKKQIADDSAKLLKLATDLKTEVDKTNKDTLSINVIRKAEAIEKLAHDVKEKMKLTVGAS